MNSHHVCVFSWAIILLFAAGCAGEPAINAIDAADEPPALPIYSPASEQIPEQTPQPTPEPSPTPPPAPMVALTFDDGPARHTDAILDILEQYDARATFFVVGNRLERYRSTVERAAAAGHEIANHSYSHPHFPGQTDCFVTDELTATSAAIAAITGSSPPIYRPPFGATNERVIEISAELGYGIVKWTLDPLDWRDRDPEIIYNRVMTAVEDGSVIVLHDIHATTAAAVELIVPSLTEMGFRLVTVSELLEERYGGLEAGNIFGSYCAWRKWDE